jgi:hypothetical protein
MTALFESSEHRCIGDAISLNFGDGPIPAKSIHLDVGGPDAAPQEQKHLTYGQIVSLAGDYYGVPDAPISWAKDKLAAFWAAYGTLMRGDPTELANIMEIIEDEQKAVDQARKEGKPPSSAFEALGYTLSCRWNEATGGGPAFLGPVGLVKHGRYMKLASMNFDHFGSDAVEAYVAGHTLAKKLALKAKPGASKDERRCLLSMAYAINAFADHFLTDLFAAGHIRTPRRALYEMAYTPAVVSNFLAMFMHNEECAAGLFVQNNRGDKWRAYGDKYLLDRKDCHNFTQVVKAVQASADDVYKAWESGIVDAPATALDFVPHIVGSDPPRAEDGNQSPMFRVSEGVVQVRTKPTFGLGNPTDYQWTPHWVPELILIEMVLPRFRAKKRAEIGPIN